MTATRALVVAALASVIASNATAQRCSMSAGVGGGDRRAPVEPRPEYDGRFAFLRLSYPASGFRGGGDPGWHHDYPRAERHFTRLLTELTSMKAHLNASVVLPPSHPDIFKYPVAYLSEPGQWVGSDADITGLRNYLKKGGFLIFDDFYGQDIYNLQDMMSRVLPGSKMMELPVNHPIFDAFYRVKSLEFYHPYYCYKSEFYGYFEDNDPKKRLLAVVNQNNDIGEAWEWSDQGVFAIAVSNEAYKLGINYLIYAMTR